MEGSTMFPEQAQQAGRRASIVPVFGAALCLTISGAASAQEPSQNGAAATAKAHDLGAAALFGEVAKAYGALASYSDQGQFVVEMTIAGKKHKQVVPLRLTFVRPNKLDFDAGAVRVTSDGAQLTTTVIPLRRYMAGAAPQKIGVDALREGPLGAVLFGGPAGGPMFVLLSLLTAPDPVASIGQLKGTFKPAPAKPAATPPAGGVIQPSRELMIDLSDGPDLILRVDPATKLLVAIELRVDPADLSKNASAVGPVAIEQLGWTPGAVTTQVALDRSFAFKPPDGFTKVDSLAGQGGAPDEKDAVSAQIGKPAPDFTLTVLDGLGKTKTITRAELAGKVILIDFWATWCGPCLMELPEIQKLALDFAGSKKDVLIVALSQDNRPVEISEVRTLVEKTLSDKRINLVRIPVARVALDPSNSVGKAFGVEGYPTIVIIDRKGFVRSAHVGFDPGAAEPLHKSLAKEIDAALAGK
jgi:thiol-disulfide isomerase/thioredoxin